MSWFKQSKKMTNDHKSTMLGAVLAALQMANIHWGNLLSGDSVEIGKGIGALTTALLGWYINKPNKEEPDEVQAED